MQDASGLARMPRVGALGPYDTATRQLLNLGGHTTRAPSINDFRYGITALFGKEIVSYVFRQV